MIPTNLLWVHTVIDEALAPLPFNREKSVCGFGIVSVLVFTFIFLPFLANPIWTWRPWNFFFLNLSH